MIKDSKMDFYSIASSRPFTYSQISWITKFTFFRVADLTVSKRPGSSYQIEIHFAFYKHSYLLFAFIEAVET